MFTPWGTPKYCPHYFDKHYVDIQNALLIGALLYLKQNKDLDEERMNMLSHVLCYAIIFGERQIAKRLIDELNQLDNEGWKTHKDLETQRTPLEIALRYLELGIVWHLIVHGGVDWSIGMFVKRFLLLLAEATLALIAVPVIGFVTLSVFIIPGAILLNTLQNVDSVLNNPTLAWITVGLMLAIGLTAVITTIVVGFSAGCPAKIPQEKVTELFADNSNAFFVDSDKHDGIEGSKESHLPVDESSEPSLALECAL